MDIPTFLAASRFHKSFTFVPSTSIATTTPNKPLRTSYSDFGDETSDAVVLFCGALVGTRLCYLSLDSLAKRNRVRVICPDRPGVGGSDGIDVAGRGVGQRVEVWLGKISQFMFWVNFTMLMVNRNGSEVIGAFGDSICVASEP